MSDDPLIGKVISDRYRVDSLLGEGAMGRVYLGEHVLMRKRVAIKFMHRELTTVPEIVQRFEREAMAAAHIDHPNVASCTDFGRLKDGTVFLILEYVEGVPLSSLIERGPLPTPRALDIALQIASALEAAHRRDIVHRDLKPDNILLLSNVEQTDLVKVLDFGIAKVPVAAGASGGPITQVGMVYGTPEYMAPEQALGQEVDSRADLYALGVILYEMLSGKRPYEGNPSTLLGQQLSQPVPLIKDRSGVAVPPGVETLVRNLLSRDQNERPARASEVVRKLAILTEAILAPTGRADPQRRRLLSSHLEDKSGLHDIRQATAQLQQKPQGSSRRASGVLLSFFLVGVGVFAGVFGLKYLMQERQLIAPVSEPAPAPEPPPSKADTDEDLSSDIQVAREKGVEALSFLAEKYPTEGPVHAALAVELARKGRHEEAVTSARTALELDPKLNENPSVRGALFRSAQSPKASAAAFRLLKGPMGAAGVDIIYDLSRVPGVRPWVKAEATQFLTTPEAREVASKALLLILDLSEAKSCEAVLNVVLRAKDEADRRALPLLGKLGSVTGCGVAEAEDCYPCLRKSSALSEAIRIVEARVQAEDAENPPSAEEALTPGEVGSP